MRTSSAGEIQTVEADLQVGLGRRRLVSAKASKITLMPSDTVKQRAIEALQNLPDNATIDDAIERLCLIAKIEEGLRQSDAGQLTDHEEVKKRFLA